MLAGALILASVLLEAELFADRGGWAKVTSARTFIERASAEAFARCQ